MGNILLKGENLTCKLQSRILFSNVSVLLAEKTCLGIYGPSGQGKSTLLKCLAQLIPFSGKIHYQTSETDLTRYRREVMYLPQKPQLQGDTVKQTLDYPFTLKVYKKSEPVNVSFESLGLSPKIATHRIRHLSGGELQRVQLLRALRLNPNILLLDEPTAALDKENQLKVEKTLQKWFKQSRKACIWISHDLEQLQRITPNIMHFDALKKKT